MSECHAPQAIDWDPLFASGVVDLFDAFEAARHGWTALGGPYARNNMSHSRATTTLYNAAIRIDVTGRGRRTWSTRRDIAVTSHSPDTGLRAFLIARGKAGCRNGGCLSGRADAQAPRPKTPQSRSATSRSRSVKLYAASKLLTALRRSSMYP